MRILIRSGKSPFDVVSYEETLARNTIGTNSGNLIFSEAAWRVLSAKGVTLTAGSFTANPKDAALINESYDHLVLPFANAFRASFKNKLDDFTKLIQNLKIPVTVLGVGAQTDASYSGKNLSEIKDSVSRFVRAVLNRSPSIGVRGEYTYDFLRKIGFNDDEVKIIGCPSLFYHGPNLPKIRKGEKIDRNSLISMNVSPYVSGIADLFEKNFAHYENLFYVPQNNESIDQLLWNGANLAPNAKVFPTSTSHALFKKNRVRFFIDPQTWFQGLKNCEFVFGTRIHGNIAALLAGVPAFVLAHDSRTLELARYFEIPHLPYTEIGNKRLAEDFFEIADYSAFEENHSSRFENYAKFLQASGLRHIYLDGEDGGAGFDQEIAKANFPAVMPSLPYQTPMHFAERMNWVQNRSSETIATLTKELSKAKKEIAGLKGNRPAC